ncbi:hypothetical protein N7457_009628 [Penicillium paradoxum]|uniref:uncharacterized protein n=1 Tax=Penicillium paradoxum TaxID=176176 RepID=UPI0025499089|nr:uncharacterized protein N7457_009628 [Penicillium paradoxum]KAJ5774732.1 hypothetical protein N7457_009628 [Penicillium paradoxum]
MKRRWCGSSWPAEAFGSPCHEGAGDLEVPDVTGQKREGKDARGKEERIQGVLKKYRDGKRELLRRGRCGWMESRRCERVMF